MASVRIIRAAIDRGTADSAHEELERFIQIHSPGIVEKEQQKVFYFDAQLGVLFELEFFEFFE
jgi:hypothetical protein